jgi:hypothetical protein
VLGWAEPDDADVVALVSPDQLTQRAFTERGLALQTLDVARLRHRPVAA